MYHLSYITVNKKNQKLYNENPIRLDYFLSVRTGASDELRQFVFEVGVCVLTKLADDGAWVLAYKLLKTFNVYGEYNTCAFTLLSAEIYIANHRPLTALTILKRELDQFFFFFFFFLVD